ncbi:MAG: hypothetical protein ACL93V_05625 [Candidatus Electrothrix sp. YB6]
MKRQLRYFFLGVISVAATINPVYADWQDVGTPGFSAGEVKCR